MNRKRVALPFPRKDEALETLHSLAALAPEERLRRLVEERETLARRLDILDAEAESIAFETICGAQDDTQHVELYDGTLGVTRAFVDEFEPPVGQLQWLNDLAVRFAGPNESPGDVSAVRWGSGGLIANDTYVTAGHCFDQFGGGWTRPRRDGDTVSPEEIATLMRVNFNYQVDGVTNETRPGDSYPVAELLEHRLGGLDFAIVRIGANDDGALPGEQYGTFVVAEEDLTDADAMLCLIQHPAGSPKKVEAGPLHDNQGGRITYDSLDTLGGSSGSPVLDPEGAIVGVHTNGGCTTFSGFNRGVAIGAIRSVSTVL